MFGLIIYLNNYIDINALKNMQIHHVEKFLSLYPLGIQIKFEANLKLWQKTLHENSINNFHDSTTTTSLVSSPASSSSSFVLNSLPQSKTSFCLESVLIENSQCAYVIDYYSLHNCLNDSCRTIIVNAIINYIIKNNISMSIALADTIGDTIVAKFPTELKVLYSIISICTYYKLILYISNVTNILGYILHQGFSQ